MKLVICLLFIFHHSESLVYGPKIHIHQGALQGTIEDSITGEKYVAFKGIPYARPPVGHLRFLDPLPAGPWKGTLNAVRYSNQCPQPSLTSKKFDGNEDCLYLNVYTPSDVNRNDSPPKSVMFWIPGFELHAGSGDDASFSPDYLVAKDVIVVTINYRIGVLGFLNLNDEAASGNQGLKDQVLALKWVQENIARFGGNPNSVTIFGTSVGAACVHYLALSPMADGLYHKVIAQSGTALNPWVNQLHDPSINIGELTAALGNSLIGPKELVQVLRTISPAQLVSSIIDPEELVEVLRIIDPAQIVNPAINPKESDEVLGTIDLAQLANSTINPKELDEVLRMIDFAQLANSTINPKELFEVLRTIDPAHLANYKIYLKELVEVLRTIDLEQLDSTIGPNELAEVLRTIDPAKLDNSTNDLKEVVEILRTVEPAKLANIGIDPKTLVETLRTTDPVQLPNSTIDLKELVEGLRMVEPARLANSTIDPEILVKILRTIDSEQLANSIIDLKELVEVLKMINPAQLDDSAIDPEILVEGLRTIEPAQLANSRIYPKELFDVLKTIDPAQLTNYKIELKELIEVLRTIEPAQLADSTIDPKELVLVLRTIDPAKLDNSTKDLKVVVEILRSVEPAELAKSTIDSEILVEILRTADPAQLANSTIDLKELAEVLRTIEPAQLANSTIDPKELVETLGNIDPAQLNNSIIDSKKTVEVDYTQLAAEIELVIKTHVNWHRFFVPTVDNKSKNPFMPIPLATAAKQGVKVPFLVGDVSDGGLRIPRPTTEEWNMYNNDLQRALTHGVSDMLKHKGISVEKIRQFYFGHNAVGPAEIKSFLEMQTDLQYTYSIHDTVAVQASKRYPTYMYKFSYDRKDIDSLAAAGLKIGGFSHGRGLNNVFYSKILSYYGFPIPVQGNTTEFVIDRVSQMWTDFAKTGDPTPAKTTLAPTKWKPVQSADIFHVMDISKNLKMEMVENINNRNLKEIQ